jgi:hypothetical protein
MAGTDRWAVRPFRRDPETRSPRRRYPFCHCAGVGRGLAVGRGRGVGAGLGVTVGVAVAVGLGVVRLRSVSAGRRAGQA